MSTVRIIIIGDEILSGKFVDENTPWLIRTCREHNLQITGIAIIRDQIDTIVQHVRDASNNATYVITTGGVGPTHDDKTIEAVAKAFNVPLIESQQLVDLINGYAKGNKALLRMATVPENYRLLDCGPGNFPQLVVENVYIFPGVPKFLKRKLSLIIPKWEGKTIHRTKVDLTVRESLIAIELEEIQNQNPDVDIGSYPRYDDSEINTIITIDGEDESRVHETRKSIQKAFQEWMIQKG